MAQAAGGRQACGRAGIQWRLCAAAVVALGWSVVGLSQATAPASQSGSTRPTIGMNDPMHPAEAPLGPDPRKLEHMREEERHKRLQADTAKLVELTNELKAQIDKASKDELSVDVVRKAAEIEKLAHDVKERMRN